LTERKIRILLVIVVFFLSVVEVSAQFDHIEMIFKLKNQTAENVEGRLKKILEIMRYRIAAFKLNETVSGIRNNRIFINIPMSKYQDRIKAVLQEEGSLALYAVSGKGGKDSKKIESRFGGKPVFVIGDPIITNGSLSEVKIAELSDGSFLLVLFLNPFATKKLARETEHLKGKKLALVISKRWVNIVKVKEKISSGEIAFPIDYPLETAMTMISVISLGPYPEAIECESVLKTEAPYTFE